MAHIGSHDATPPTIVEYGYYGVLFYSVVAPGLGIQIPMFSGGMLVILAAICVNKAGRRPVAVYEPLKLPLACALSVCAVDVVVYGGSILGEPSRTFIIWMATVILVYSLSLRRGFLHRCALVFWVMGLTTLPYLIAKGGGVGTLDERLAVDSSTLSGSFNNSNGLGSWFGFCCLYFAIVAIETRRIGLRVACGLVVIMCLFVVGLTVSRGSLLGTALGLVIAFRRVLRRGFVPLLVLVVFLGVGYIGGLFDDMMLRYANRGAEETGRFVVWPFAIERFLESPIFGVGSANAGTWVPGNAKAVAPHNSFLWFALSGGVVPLALFVAWWIQMGRTAVLSRKQPGDAVLRLPLLVYTFVNAVLGDLGFMVPWAVIALSTVMPPNTTRTSVRRPVVTRRTHSTTEALGHS